LLVAPVVAPVVAGDVDAGLGDGDRLGRLADAQAEHLAADDEGGEAGVVAFTAG
jgi:hypothetical protein